MLVSMLVSMLEHPQESMGNPMVPSFPVAKIARPFEVLVLGLGLGTRMLHLGAVAGMPREGWLIY